MVGIFIRRIDAAEPTQWALRSSFQRCWNVEALGAPHVGERPEKELISSFVNRIAKLSPQLVTFNGSSFDLPVLRYRDMVHGVAAPGLASKPYFNRYTEDAVDLCDVLSSFSFQGKATLHELSRVMGFPGKPDGMAGGEVERYYREGRIKEIADYCETDVASPTACGSDTSCSGVGCRRQSATRASCT